MRTAIAFLLLAQVALAQGAPTPTITGPTKAKTGDIIILDASTSGATHYSWLVDASDVTMPESAQQDAKKTGGAATLAGLQSGAAQESRSIPLPDPG